MHLGPELERSSAGHDNVEMPDRIAADVVAKNFAPQSSCVLHHSPPYEFARTIDLLRSLGDLIHDRQSLLSLCLACRRFNFIFTPFLYDELTIGNRWACLRRLGREEYASRLCHSRKLSYIFQGNPPINWRRVNTKVQNIIGRMKRLQHFQWHGIWLHPDTLHLLGHHCPDLNNLDVCYPSRKFDEWFQANEAPMSPAPGLVSLTNLTSLTLLNLDVAMSLERSGLPAILANNPGLRLLALSVSESSMPQTCLTYRNQPWCTHLFNDMSDRFNKLCPTPLRLKSLHLGLGFVPQNRPFGATRLTAEESLKQLVDLSVLEYLHIDNRCMRSRHRRQGVHIRSTERVYDLISTSNTPRLRRLSVFREDNEFIQWWRRTAEGDFFRRLSLSFVVPPRLEMVDESISNWHGSLSEDMLADLHQIPRMMELSFAAYQWKQNDLIDTKLHILEELAVSGRHVEGLFLWLGEDWMDALRNGGGTLFRRMEACLARLRRLRQLALGIRVPGLDSSESTKMQRRDLAKHLAQQVTQIRYLMVFPDAWWVTHDKKLVPLSQTETQDVELFKNPIRPSPDLVTADFWHRDLKSVWLGNHVDGDLVFDKT